MGLEELALSDVLGAIVDLGLTGFLIVSIWLFVKGKIWPKEMVDKALEAQSEIAQKNSELISKQICEQLSEGVKKGISEGIAEGYIKINSRDA